MGYMSAQTLTSEIRSAEDLPNFPSIVELVGAELTRLTGRLTVTNRRLAHLNEWLDETLRRRDDDHRFLYFAEGLRASAAALINGAADADSAAQQATYIELERWSRLGFYEEPVWTDHGRRFSTYSALMSGIYTGNASASFQHWCDQAHRCREGQRGLIVGVLILVDAVDEVGEPTIALVTEPWTGQVADETSLR